MAWLHAHVADYDMGWDSAYNLYKDPATTHYNTLHVQLLNLFGRIAGDPLFAQYAQRFSSYAGIGSLPFHASATNTLDPAGHGPSNLLLTATPHTYWSGRTPVSITLDLGSPHTVYGLVLAQANPATHPAALLLDSSDDGHNWAADMAVPSLTWLHGRANLAAHVHSRFLRLRITKGLLNYVGLSYIQVEGR
jgi:hypothetical protein